MIPFSPFKVILGIDRLDYTKGLVARLKALEHMFEEYPLWRGKVAFLQVQRPLNIPRRFWERLRPLGALAVKIFRLLFLQEQM